MNSVLMGFLPNVYVCLVSYNPVRIEALLYAQMEVVTKAFVNRMPFSARLSIVGVCIIGWPAHDIISFLWSSMRKNKILGFSTIFLFVTLQAIKSNKKQ
jgi:hypothetical protein